MILLLWLGLIFIPFVIGEGILTVLYKKTKREHTAISEGFVLGGIVCIGGTEVAHVAGLFLDLSLMNISCILGASLVGLALIALLLLIFDWWKQRDQELTKCPANERTMFPFAFIVVVFLQALFVFCREPIVIPGDIIPETVQSFLSEDGIYRVMPLTGTVSEMGMPLRYKILCLPTLYAVLCHGFGTEASLLVCHIIPLAVMGGTYISFYYLSGMLFSRNDIKNRYLFLFIVAVLLLFTDRGVFSSGYGLLHGGYLGTSIRNLILVPYALAAALDRRWWKAVLCVFAEACICWTLWGLGVCLVIVAGVAMLTLLERKCPKVGKFMQIFQRKEDLT